MAAGEPTRYHETDMPIHALERLTGILRPGLAAVLLGLVSISAGLSQPAADPAALARKTLDSLLGQNYADFAALASPQLKTNMNEQALASWAPRSRVGVRPARSATRWWNRWDRPRW